MKRAARSAVVWRCGVVLFALMAVVQLGIELFNAPRVLRVGTASEALFEGSFLRERGPTMFVVDGVPPASPLAAVGVVRGDRLQWDAPIGRWHNLAAGDRVELTVLHGDQRRRVEVTMPAATQMPRLLVANYVLDMAGRLAALLLGVILGWRRPDLVTFRALAAAGLTNAFVFPYSAPAAAHLPWLDFIGSVSQQMGPPTLVFFALNYPDDKPTGWRATLKRYFPWYFVLQLAVEIAYFARLYAGYHEPALGALSRYGTVVLAALFFWSLLMAWRQAQGESRVRLQWIFATIGTIMAVILLGTLNGLAGNAIPPEELGLVQNIAALVAEAGLVYAVLRKRIFDFGLAVNRTLVFGIVGAILLGIFQVANGIVGQFLHFDDKNKTILLSAILAVAVYLSFNQLKKVVEKVVDRLLFSHWAASDEDLKRFVAQAKHASDAGALSTLLVEALDRFTAGAGCALYQQREASFARVGSTLAAAPDEIGVNDEAVLSMRADDRALRLRESSSTLRAALAVPMAHRGALLGFVLIGGRPDGEPYRSDQVEALEHATHAVGLDFYALQLERLAAEAAAQRRTAETLRAQLETAMALALAKRGPREG